MALVRIAVTCAVIVGVLLAGAARLVADGRSALAASDEARAQGDPMRAIVEARRAARAFVPGAAHMEKGCERLRLVAQDAERKGDLETALFGWRAVSAIAVSARPYSSGCQREEALAQAAVQRLSEAARVASRPLSGVTVQRGGRPALARPEVPAAGWGALLLVGAALFGGAGVRWSSRRWSTDGRTARGEARIAAVMAAAGLASWLAALLFG